MSVIEEKLVATKALIANVDDEVPVSKKRKIDII